MKGIKCADCGKRKMPNRFRITRTGRQKSCHECVSKKAKFTRSFTGEVGDGVQGKGAWPCGVGFCSQCEP